MHYDTANAKFKPFLEDCFGTGEIILTIQHIDSSIAINHLVIPLPLFQRVLRRYRWRHQVIIEFADSLPVSIMESCHSDRAKLELIQFVTVTSQTLIKKDLQTMAWC